MKISEMQNYLDTVDDSIKQYFSILSKDRPEWLVELLQAPELLQQHIDGISLRFAEKCQNFSGL